MTRPRRFRAVLVRLFLIILVLVLPGTAGAQQDGFAPVQNPTSLRWWHGAMVIGGLSALMLLDNPVRRFTQNERSSSLNDLASTVRHVGQPEVYGTVTAGLVAAGLLTGNHEVTRAGGRLAVTLALAGATSTFAKLALGRPRPSESLDADGYSPFSGQDAMPSGHTTMAFALAAALADDLHRTWTTVGLYSVASAVGWSRINDNRHWLTDALGGAAVGITSAKLVNGHWRIFHLRPPGILLGPRSAGLAWQVQF